MKFTIVKRAVVWVKSFFATQTIAKSVMVAGDVRVESTPRKPYPEVVRFKPYDNEYLLVSLDRDFRRRKADDIGSPFYKFYDPLTKKEFILSSELVTLLFYQLPREVQ